MRQDVALADPRLEEIVDSAEIQLLMNDFYDLTHIGIAISDMTGKVLVATGWQDICTRFHRVHPETRKHCIESDLELSSGVEPGTWKLYKCKNNMWDMATPIMVGGRHVGNLFLGQFFFEGETPDWDFFREQARRYGFDEKAYLEALNEVPIWPRERVETVFRFYTRLATMISDLSFSNLRLSQSLTREKAIEKRYRDLAESLPEMIFEVDTSGRMTYANPVAFKKWKYTPDDMARGLWAVDMFIPEDRPQVAENMKKLFEGTISGLSEYTALRKDGDTFPVLVHSTPVFHGNKPVGITGLILDQTEVRQRTRLDHLTQRVQAVLLRNGRKEDLLQKIIEDILKTLNFEAGAIRFKDGDDYPYCAVVGLSEDFVEAERYLCAFDENGALIQDEDGNPVLECMCGNIIEGRTDPSKPFFTVHGSFWTNSASDMATDITEVERPLRARRRCVNDGYESVALIPLPCTDGTGGLLQLNDKHRDCFSPSLMAGLEGIARQIAEGLDRIQAREALQESENKLRLILDSSPDVIVQLDRDLRVMWANKTANDAVDGLIGKTCPEAFVGGDLSCEGCPCKKAIESGRIERDVMYHEHAQMVADSESYWDTIGIPMRDCEGQVTSVIEIARNVTNLKRAEKRLEKINECLLGLGTDFDANVNRITALCGEIFGATCALYNRLQGGLLCSLGQWKTPGDYNPTDRPNGHICFDIIQDAKEYPVVIRHLDQTKYMQTDPNVAAYQLKTYIGQMVHCGTEPVGSLCVVFQDDVDPSEEDKGLLGILAAALGKEEAQKRAEEAYSRICRIATQLICVADLNTATFLQVNPAFEHTLGYTSEEMCSRPFLDFVHPDDVEKTTAIVRKQLSQGDTVLRFENRYRRKDGSYRFLEWNSHPNRDEGLLYAVAHDITERKQFEEDLQNARDAAEAANRAKSAFLANMSHELRTPLNPVIGFTEMLLEEPDLPEEHRECLEIVNQRSQDLLRLLNDILDIARIEADRMTLKVECVDVRTLITDVIKLYEIALSGKAVTLCASVASNVPETVRLDPLRLRQILMNLIGNAAKFTEQGKIEVSVWSERTPHATTHAPPAGMTLFFKVTDTGIGIPADKLDSIFLAFEQGDNTFTREYSGAGLGLAICKRLIRLMKGQIGVQSEEGKGSIFTFSIPVQRSSASAESPAVSPKEVDAPFGTDIHILLVEDDTQSRVLAERLLRRAGYRVDSVVDGQQAVDACKKETYDAIVMDVKMPVMDGLEATRLIRMYEQKQNRHTPILAMTAFAFEEDREACLTAGMDDYVTKPLVIGSFVETFNRCVVRLST
ncbi:MAG: PAS domain S-box protein [Spartobacteria bacterium]|nr:PAS domain S-box protein [Spartobacteria bacterium]